MKHTKLGALGIHAGLIAAGVIVLFPFVWITLAAFKTQISLMIGEVAFTPTLANFNEVLFSGTSDYIANYRNSLIVATASTLIVLIVATLGAYSIERLGWPRWVVHGFLLGAAVFNAIPAITLVGAWYVGFRALGLYNTYPAVILAHATYAEPADRPLADGHVHPRSAARAGRGGADRRLWDAADAVACRCAGRDAGHRSDGDPRIHSSAGTNSSSRSNLTARQTATVPVAIAKYAQEESDQVRRHGGRRRTVDAAVARATVLCSARDRARADGGAVK